MTANKSRSILALVAFSAVPLFAGSPQGALIKGKVVNEYGAPMPLSQVLVEDQDRPKAKEGVVTVETGAVPWVEADKQGNFVIDRLVTGHHYKVYAKNEQEGYPDATDLFYNPEDKAPIVAASKTPQEVQVSLGPKGVLLKYSAVDEVTGKGITDLTISVKRGDGKEGGFEGSAMGNQILLPADAPIVFSLSAKGYHEWFYPTGAESASAAQPVRSYAGGTEQIKATLRKQ